MHSAYKREHDGSQTKVYDNPFSDKGEHTSNSETIRGDVL